MPIESEKLLAKNDQVLEEIIRSIPRPVIDSTNDIFHDVMSCILEQQIHYRSKKRIFAKALERASIDILTPSNFHLLEEYSLGEIKLSMDKFETMMGFKEYWDKNLKDFQMLSDEEVRIELSSIKGIGKWTIDMILLFTLERPNVFPYDDFHLKQIMASLYGLDEKSRLKAQMIEIAERWGEQKSLAVLYLLEWKQRLKNL